MRAEPKIPTSERIFWRSNFDFGIPAGAPILSPRMGIELPTKGGVGLLDKEKGESDSRRLFGFAIGLAVVGVVSAAILLFMWSRP